MCVCPQRDVFPSRARSQRSSESQSPDSVKGGGILGVQRRGAVQFAAAERVRHVRTQD